MISTSESNNKENKERVLFPLQSPFSDRKRAFFVVATRFATIVREFLSSDQQAELDGLLELMRPETEKYRLCELKDCGGDLKKRWHIQYYAFNTVTNKLERFRHYMPASEKTAAQRKIYFRDFKEALDEQLKSGKTVAVEPKKEAEKQVETIWALLDMAFANKRNKITNTKTVNGFKFSVDLVKEWLVQSEQKGLLAKDFDRSNVFKFVDWFQDDYDERNGERMSNRTFNNYKNNIGSLFGELVDRGYFIANPLSIVKNRQITESANFPFNEAQKKLVLSYLLNNGQMCDYFFCSFMYYTCSRPTEIIKLKRKNIYPDRILFQGGLAKNKKVKYVPITEGCRQLLDKMGILNKPPEAYIFSKGGEIGGYVPTGENWYGKRHTLVLDALGLHNGDYTMYSWKDTGACDLYLATKDIMFVKDMCRHSTVAFTEIYLRGMGILLNNTSSGNAPKLSI